MFHRDSIRLRNHDYRVGVYFITLVTYRRRRLFGSIQAGRMLLSAAGEVAHEQWQNVAHLRTHVLIDEFVVMPDHFHAIVWLRDDTTPYQFRRCSRLPGFTFRKFSGSQGPSLMTVVGSYKAGVSRYLRLFDGSLKAVWQRNYYERLIRSQEDLERCREYIRNNPKNWKG